MARAGRLPGLLADLALFERVGDDAAQARCLIKIAPSSGVYSVGQTSIYLTYTSDFRLNETAEFAFNKRQTQLTGADWGAKLTLTRVR